MIEITLSDAEAIFHDGLEVAAVYVLNDPFKPYFHPLRTPAGHVVTEAMPADHRHHKGLMYALRCPDLNFWEENPGGGGCGIQRILHTSVTAPGELTQELLWCEEGGGLETYRESRIITCRRSDDGAAYQWTWRSRRESLRDHRLMKSQWSAPTRDGRRINYHGLGIRLPWSWAYPSDHLRGVQADGVDVSFADAHGGTPRCTLFHGAFDGRWKPDRGTVSIAQIYGYSYYVMPQPFAFLAVGPSNAEELDVRSGQIFDETYDVVVADIRERRGSDHCNGPRECSVAVGRPIPTKDGCSRSPGISMVSTASWPTPGISSMTAIRSSSPSTRCSRRP